MKKIVLALSLLLLCSGVGLIAVADNTSVLDSLRSFVKENINSTVAIIKNNFNAVETDRNALAEDVDDLDERVDVLLNSDNVETDGSVLKHGKAEFVRDCDYTKENLKWNGTAWDCVETTPFVDCSPNNGEFTYESPADSNNYKCKQNYTFAKVAGDWSECNETTGNKYAYENCQYQNTTDDSLKYIVNDSYCSSLVTKIKACNDKSSCTCPDGLTFKYDSNNEIVGCEKGIKFTNPESDMSYTFNDGVLTWGKSGVMWRGNCTMYSRKIKFDYDPRVLTSLKLIYALFDDYIWIKINGRYVYGGPDSGIKEYVGQAYKYKSCHTTHGGRNDHTFCRWAYSSNPNVGDITSEAFYTTDNRTYKCERNTVWKTGVNIPKVDMDLTRYLVRGENTIEVILSVADEGYLSTKFKFDTKAGTETALPICTVSN